METEHVNMPANMAACEELDAPKKETYRCIKCKALSLEQFNKYLNDPQKMTKYLKRLVQCSCNRISCPWTGRYGFEKRRRERAEECRVLEKVMKMLLMPQIVFRNFEPLPQFETFPHNTWVIGAFFPAFGQFWSVQFMLLTPPKAENEQKQALLRCSFQYVLRLETPDTCHRPLGLSYTVVSSEYMDMRFEPNLCEKYNFTSYNLDGLPTELYRNSYRNVVNLLKERNCFRIIMAPTDPACVY